MTGARPEVAITGMACRLPGGVRGPDDLWDLLCTGGNGVVPVPPSRWDAEPYASDTGAPGKAYVQAAGFLDDVTGFDAAYFGISPREARMMDPQQRIFLEVACEAIESAGIALDSLRGSVTGVFTGIYLNDYAERFSLGTPDLLEPYYLTGNALSGAPGRLAHVLGLEGPVMAVDAACSSSLVAVHLAARALRAGDCDLAIAGGVNIILSPKVAVSACRGHVLAPDGQCKTFDRTANGYARGEGCGVVVLKRADDARADRDRVRAIVAGSAVRHGGRTAGLTVPGSRSQTRLLTAALADAEVTADAIDYVESHGTGTPLGDPIEMRALKAVYGRASGNPCWVGALKTNLGHLEPASGVAGLIKTVLSMEHRVLPRNLHFSELNPAIDLTGSRIRLPLDHTPLPDLGGNRHAAVSSFGMTGTIAHVVVREGDPAVPDRPDQAAEVMLLPLSARAPVALRALAAATADALDEATIAAMVSTAAHRRSHSDYRAAVVGRSVAELTDGLTALAAGKQTPAVRQGKRRDSLEHGVVFVFSGRGSQWPLMGTQLRGPSFEAFEETLAHCDALIRTHTGWSVRDQIANASADRLGDSELAQPAIFAVQVALAALWRSWGIVPDGVIGHSMGEVAAAHVAGALDLADAVRITCLRSKLAHSVAGEGGMAHVELPSGEVAELLGDRGEVTVGAVNSPHSTVIAGAAPALRAVTADLRGRGIVVRDVDIDYAPHCPLVDPVLAELGAGLGDISPSTPRIPMYSTVTGGPVAGQPLDAAYWQHNLRQPVLFWPAVQAAMADANDIFVEVSPHPILLPGLTADAEDIIGFPSLRRNHDQKLTMLSTLAGLYTEGRVPHWPTLTERGQPVDLPRYPWQHTDFMLPEVSQTEPRAVVDETVRDWVHRIVWKPQPGTARSLGTGRWIVLADRHGIAAHVRELLENHGVRCDVQDDIKGLDGRIAGVVDLTSIGAGDIGEPVYGPCLRAAAAADAVESLAAELWLVTAGTQSAVPGQEVRTAGAELWGLGRAFAEERPGLNGFLVDLDPADPAQMAAQLVETLAVEPHRETVWRNGERLLPKLEAIDLRAAELPLLRKDSAYLITGGLGSVGLALARWLGDRGARRVLLAGRTAMPPRHTWRDLADGSRDGKRAADILSLEAAGLTVETVLLDVGDPAEVARFVSEYEQAGRPPIRGVFHLAAALADELSTALTADGLTTVLTAKALGAKTLDAHFPDVDHFVLFSSAAALFPLPGQAGYAAANAYLGALAARRRARGQAGLAVHWSVWEGRGLAESAGGQRTADLLRSAGLQPLPDDGALSALGLLMGADSPEATVLRLDDGVDLRKLGLAAMMDGERPRSEILNRYTEAPHQARAELVLDWLQEAIATITGMTPDQVDPSRPFAELGMDSMMAVQLRGVLQRDLGIRLSATVAFSHPTTKALAGHLHAQLAPPEESAMDEGDDLVAVLLAAQQLDDGGAR